MGDCPNFNHKSILYRTSYLGLFFGSNLILIPVFDHKTSRTTLKALSRGRRTVTWMFCCPTLALN